MKTLEGTVTVLNVPPYALGKYLTVKSCYGEVWFHNAWDTEEEAIKNAKELENGFVVRG